MFGQDNATISGQADVSGRQNVHCERDTISGLTFAYPPEHILISQEIDDSDPFLKYKTRKRMIDPRSVVVLGDLQREFRPLHAETLRESFESTGYSTEFGMISWTENKAMGLKLCISGQHRIAAILKMFLLVKERNEDPHSTIASFEMLETIEYYHESRADIPISEVLILAGNSNDKSSCVAAPSLADKMRTLLTFMRITVSISRMSVSSVIQLVEKKRVLRGLKTRSLRRYVDVALILKDNPNAESAFCQFANEDKAPNFASPGGMSMNVLSNNILKLCSPAGQVLAIICANKHYVACKAESAAGAARKRGGENSQLTTLTEASAGAFFRVVKVLSETVRSVSEPRLMNEFQVLDYVVAHTANAEPQKASFFIAEQMKSWRSMDQATEKRWVRCVQRFVVQRLITALPPKPTHKTPHLSRKPIDLDLSYEGDHSNNSVHPDVGCSESELVPVDEREERIRATNISVMEDKSHRDNRATSRMPANEDGDNAKAKENFNATKNSSHRAERAAHREIPVLIQKQTVSSKQLLCVSPTSNRKSIYIEL